jgi:hypothetical protein
MQYGTAGNGPRCGGLGVLVLLALMPFAESPDPGAPAQECASYGPQASGFALVGAWDKNERGQSGSGVCDQIRAEPLSLSTKMLVRCACTMLLEARETAQVHMGMRLLRTARRLLPPHDSAWRLRHMTDHALYRFPVWESASPEHRDLLLQVMELRKQQARTDCASVRALVVHLDDLPNLGATLQLLNAGLSFARMSDRILVMAGGQRTNPPHTFRP